ncbi:MAG: 50S ribosomal protein L19 [Patescibacteria group bacterium]
MSKLLDQFNKLQITKVPDIKPGDAIKVHQKIKEGNKERIQIFEGIVIARKHGKGISATITVRKVVEGVGVERVFPVYSPAIAKIEVVRSAKVRRAKLYYLRTAKGKKARLKKKEFVAAIADESVEEPVAEEAVEIPTEPTSEENQN